mgnify:CR=1 FL=1
MDDTTAPNPSRSTSHTSLMLGIAVGLLAIGGAVTYSHLNDRITGLEKQSTEAQATINALTEKTHLSAAEIERLRSTTAHVAQAVTSTSTQLASTRRKAEALAQQAAQTAQEVDTVKQDTSSKFGSLNGDLSGVKGEVTGVKTDVASTKADLEDTKLKLQRAVGDLGLQSGLIAHTREDLEALRRKGDRDYFEFSLTKSKHPTRVGPISIALKKADPKHERFTAVLFADDQKIEKKDKTINEPVQFYTGRGHALHEMVVNQISKNKITGYISAPKYTDGAAR